MNAEKLDELYNKCLKCRNCSLCKTRTNLVFGTGNPDAEIMLIGEGPGEQEDLKGEPFVGRAGMLLDDMLRMIDIDRSMIYIANIVKCRPPKNRDPLFIEQDACRHWLDEQLSIIDPKIIICLGRISATAIIRDDFKITREHGQWFDIDGRMCMAIYHPAALLRDESKRPETFADLRKIRKALKDYTYVYQKDTNAT